MSTLTATRMQSLPRVNLLPPEIGEKQRFKRVQAGLGAAVVGAVLVVGALYVVASGQVNDAQGDLDASKAESAQLTSQTAQYANVPVVYAQVAAAESQLTQAIGQEVRWSFYLNDLSLTIPKDVWLENMTVAQNVDAAAQPAATGAAQGGNPVATPGIGTVTFSGKGMAHNDVASWLDSLATQKGYADPYFTNSAKAEENGKDVVTFSSSVTVTDEALSKRYTQKAGN